MVFRVCVGHNIGKINACFNGMLVHSMRGSAIASATVVAAGVSPAWSAGVRTAHSAQPGGTVTSPRWCWSPFHWAVAIVALQATCEGDRLTQGVALGCCNCCPSGNM